jgi:hypothetical protein
MVRGLSALWRSKGCALPFFAGKMTKNALAGAKRKTLGNDFGNLYGQQKTSRNCWMPAQLRKERASLKSLDAPELARIASG